LHRFAFCALLISVYSSASAQRIAPADVEVIDVPLVAWVVSRDHALPNTLPDFAETDERQTNFRAFTDALSAHNWSHARHLAAASSYQIVAINERDTWFVVASDDSNSGRGPTLIVNASPRRDVILEAPHVPFEPGTAEQAVTLLRDLAGRAVIVSGAHRCASRSFTSCDGRTSVCGSLQAYRDSDAGHNTGTLFNAAHVLFAERWNQSLVVSLHGMKEDEAGNTQIILSNGIHGEDKGQMTAATKLRWGLGNRPNPPGTVVDCNYPADDVFNYRKLCGFTNVQGRHANGAADACRQNVDVGTGRFVHLEQGWRVLRPYARHWARLYENEWARAILDAFANVVPAIP
jgi:hypothetical protein